MWVSGLPLSNHPVSLVDYIFQTDAISLARGNKTDLSHPFYTTVTYSRPLVCAQLVLLAISIFRVTQLTLARHDCLPSHPNVTYL